MFEETLEQQTAEQQTAPEGEGSIEEPSEGSTNEEGQEGGQSQTEPTGEDGGQGGAEPRQEQPQVSPEVIQALQNQLFRQLVGNIPNPETGKPFENPAEFSAWRQKAETAQRARQAGMEPDQYQKIAEEAAQRIKQTDPEVLGMRAQLEQFQRRQMEETFSRDMAAIKAAYPDEQAKSVMDLGEDFMALMATGQLDAVGAYEAIRRKRNAGRKQPPSMGAVATGGSEPKTFYTRDEVARMTPAEVEKNLDAINKSMAKWK